MYALTKLLFHKQKTNKAYVLNKSAYFRMMQDIFKALNLKFKAFLFRTNYLGYGYRFVAAQIQA
jgi:hypothetical protein